MITSDRLLPLRTLGSFGIVSAFGIVGGAMLLVLTGGLDAFAMDSAIAPKSGRKASCSCKCQELTDYRFEQQRQPVPETRECADLIGESCSLYAADKEETVEGSYSDCALEAAERSKDVEIVRPGDE